jgi:hypothetical protein
LKKIFGQMQAVMFATTGRNVLQAIIVCDTRPAEPALSIALTNPAQLYPF